MKNLREKNKVGKHIRDKKKKSTKDRKVREIENEEEWK